MILSLDIGATNIRSAVIVNKEVKDKKIIRTPANKEQIKKAIFSLVDSYSSTKCICVGIASFIKNNKTRNTCNMDFSGINLKKLLQKRYHSEIYVDNDANCAGLGELFYGNGKGRKNFIVLTLGTGIGGAIIIGGKLYRGTGFAGEPGQIIIDGKRLETIASGTAAINLAEKYGFKERDNKAIAGLADKGNAKARSLYKKIGNALGMGLLNISYIYDPEIIILGGGFSNVSYVVNEAKKVLHKNDIIKRNIPVVRAKLGDNAGLIGAALLPRT